MTSPRKATHGADSEAGFTLIEMLIALTLLSVIFVMITGGISTARLAMNAAERRSQRIDIPFAQEYLRSAIMQTVVFSGNSPRGDTAVSFEGGPNELDFITSFAPQAQVQGLYHVSLRLIPAASGGGLFDLIVVQSLFPAREGGNPQVTATVVPAVANAVFSYFGDQEKSEGKAWQPTWINREGPPSLFSIDVVFRRGDERGWPTLIVPLNLSM